jgi:mannose-1-phosphate guanylyltransferase
LNQLYALVMAGGKGTRFWPQSRRRRPKQVTPLGGGPSLLRATVDRLLPLVPAERILVVTGEVMLDAVREEVPDIPPDNVLVEPSGRNTAPCVGWGAVEVGRRGGGDAVMAVLPSDHRITKPDQLRAVLQAAADAARQTNALVTVGITPTRPETGFGYLEVGTTVGEWGGWTFAGVERFVEKPDRQTAERYVSEGRHLWNAGMFLFTVDSIRDAFRHYLPRSAEALEELQHDPSRLHELWERLEETSIDYGVMERSRHLLTVPSDIGWSDLGSWNALPEVLPEVEGGWGEAKATVGVDARRCVVHAPDKLVALLGVSDLVVVDTPDAILVMDRHRAQEVRRLIARLEALDLEKYA